MNLKVWDHKFAIGVLVLDLGLDRLVEYSLRYQSLTFVNYLQICGHKPKRAIDTETNNKARGVGPRHLAFHSPNTGCLKVLFGLEARIKRKDSEG